MLINVILPVILVVLGGYLFGKYTNVDHSSISRFAMMLLSPALIFSFLVRNSLTTTEMMQTVGAVLLFTVLVAILTFVILQATGQKHMITPGLLSTVFPNTGNYGLPVLLFAYGEEAFSLGVVVVVMNFILMYTLGVYFASLEGGDWRKGVRNVIKLPTTYAALLAIVVNVFHIPIPDFIYNPVKLVGDAMIPVVLLILGMQLSKTTFRGAMGATVTMSTIRLLLSPLLMIGIVALLHIDGMVAKVLVLQHATPTAVIMSMIAAEYRAQPNIVANVTFLSTIASFATMTMFLYLVDYLY